MISQSDYEPKPKQISVADADAIRQLVDNAGGDISTRDILRCAHDLQMERRTIVRFAKQHGWTGFGKMVNQHEWTYSQLSELPENKTHPVFGAINNLLGGHDER